MQDIDTLRRTVATTERAAAGYYVVERIEFTPEGVPIVEAFPDRGSALARFRELAGEGTTKSTALRMIAEGGFYQPAFKVKFETASHYRLLYGLEETAPFGE